MCVTFRKKTDMNINNHTSHHSTMVTKPLNTSKKKKSTPKVAKTNNTPIVSMPTMFHIPAKTLKTQTSKGFARLS
jgi:hypothetical protein